MPVTLSSPLPASAKPKPARTRPRMTLEELLRRAAASVEKGPARIIGGTFRQVKRGRALTRFEQGLLVAIPAALLLAICLHALPAPVNAHATLYRSLAGTTRIDASAPRTFAEQAVRAIGRDWRAESFFATMAPAYWQDDAKVHPNTRVARVEHGLADLAAHGPVVSVTSFADPTAVDMEVVAGTEMLGGRIEGQLELADGAVVRFVARVAQDAATRRWLLVGLAIPEFLP